MYVYLNIYTCIHKHTISFSLSLYIYIYIHTFAVEQERDHAASLVRHAGAQGSVARAATDCSWVCLGVL